MNQPTKKEMLLELTSKCKKEVTTRAKACGVNIAEVIVTYTPDFVTFCVENDSPVNVEIWLVDVIGKSNRGILVNSGITYGKFDWKSDTYIKPTTWVRFTI